MFQMGLFVSPPPPNLKALEKTYYVIRNLKVTHQTNGTWGLKGPLSFDISLGNPRANWGIHGPIRVIPGQIRGIRGEHPGSPRGPLKGPLSLFVGFCRGIRGPTGGFVGQSG